MSIVRIQQQIKAGSSGGSIAKTHSSSLTPYDSGAIEMIYKAFPTFSDSYEIINNY